MERTEQELVRIGKLDAIREYCNPYPENSYFKGCKRIGRWNRKCKTSG